MSNNIDIKLNKDTAWILFDLVNRFSETGRLSIEDQAEERALWNLCCIFEKTLCKEESTDYKNFINQCRDRLRDA